MLFTSLGCYSLYCRSFSRLPWVSLSLSGISQVFPVLPDPATGCTYSNLREE